MVMHTTFARFPDKPTKEESESLQQYIFLFQRLYPCGECSEHFAKLLKKFPPQVSSRSTAAAWGCHVHNEVNKKLKKELFDCSKIGDFYDCGCADGDEDKANDKTKQKSTKKRQSLQLGRDW
jgi:FAD-linked sulfhydryl oxidase